MVIIYVIFSIIQEEPICAFLTYEEADRFIINEGRSQVYDYEIRKINLHGFTVSMNSEE